MTWNIIALIIELAFLVGIAVFMTRRTRSVEAEPIKPKTTRQNTEEAQRIAKMRARGLNVPLNEKMRPLQFSDIVGQEEGIRGLKAALCGPNPQHVIIYGPPGVGKTCAARLVLEEAKRRPNSPFGEDAQFVEIDATCVRFDERAIADPLIGSVHDPIYQGAGALGAQGVPQPKPGAVTRAHCGVLFLDEIGELHPMQMNKLLKVLEDRCVKFESAYYSEDNNRIPQHIHDIFRYGLPADFRLVGATTRRPEELPPAIRSRCVELFFRPLEQEELMQIAAGAAARTGYRMDEESLYQCALHAQSGRDAVNIVQLACGIACDEGRDYIEQQDVAWVTRTCRYSPRMELKLPQIPRIGAASGLAVTGMGSGMALEIECDVRPAAQKRGQLSINGIVEEEELSMQGRKLRRKSMARGSVENVLCAFAHCYAMDAADYDIRFNIPGGMPVDGPSAGTAIAVALMSALTRQPVEPLIAFTGEITIHGEVRPVGGVREKIRAAQMGGARCVVIPAANWEQDYADLPVKVEAISDIAQLMTLAFAQQAAAEESTLLGAHPAIHTAVLSE